MKKIAGLIMLLSMGAGAQSFTPKPRLMYTMVDGSPTPASGSGAVLPFMPDPVLCYGLNGEGQPAPCDFTGGDSGLSGMTAGQVPIAATATTITSSMPLAGTGPSVTTGPSSSISGHLVEFVGTAGQIADGGAPPSGTIVGTTDTQTLSNKTFVAPVLGAATATSLTASGNLSGANIGVGETTITSATTALNSAAQIITVDLVGNYTFTLAATNSGKNFCLQFVQPATGGPFIVTPPANVLGFFAGSSGLIGTTASKGSEQCFTFSSARSAWTPTSGGVINF